MDPKTIRLLKGKLPDIRLWIEELLGRHSEHARCVSTLGFTGLAESLPEDLLQRTKGVVVERVPFPPVHELGLPEFATFQKMSLIGITFGETIFVKKGHHREESLYFHELVHVVQWGTLGADAFLLAYGVGLIMFGYEGNPFEQIAYSMQRRFETRTLPPNPVNLIEEHTLSIWGRLKRLHL